MTTRSTAGLNLKIQPGSSVYVTLSSTGTAATIYSDPELSLVIPNATVVADVNGGYGYYIPLNYMVTETISSPNNGSVVIPNIGVNGVIVGSLTTTSASSDVFSATGIVSTSHVSLTPTNSAAATMIASTYVSAKSTGSITISHTGTAGATFDVLVTPY